MFMPLLVIAMLLGTMAGSGLGFLIFRTVDAVLLFGLGGFVVSTLLLLAAANWWRIREWRAARR